MSMTAADIAHHLETIRRLIAATEHELVECKRLTSIAKSLTCDDVVTNARELHAAAQALRYWLASRVRA